MEEKTRLFEELCVNVASLLGNRWEKGGKRSQKLLSHRTSGKAPVPSAPAGCLFFFSFFPSGGTQVAEDPLCWNGRLALIMQLIGL